MLGLEKTPVFWPGAVLTSVIDMFMFYREFWHQFAIVLVEELNFWKVMMTDVT